MIIDDEGYIFTPTALYLEAEGRPEEAPNTMRLSNDQVKEALARLSPASKAIAVALAKTDEEKQRIMEQAVEVPSEAVADDRFAAVDKQLEEVPPVQFDVARQVRVFNAYLQYVELKLSGAAIQRHRLAIPPSIQKLGGDTLPIIRRKDEKKYDGGYRTKRVILEIYEAMHESICSGQPYQPRLDPPPADPRCCHPARELQSVER